MTRVNYLDNDITALDDPPQLAPELQVLLVRSHHSSSILLKEGQLSSPVEKVLVFLLKIGVEFSFKLGLKYTSLSCSGERPCQLGLRGTFNFICSGVGPVFSSPPVSMKTWRWPSNSGHFNSHRIQVILTERSWTCLV